ncbi:MAG TPA: biotin--[acetyl-CoA-carboxylase] ligase, partial [Ruminococcaceae bacterium]|nr:biotin--[acetyl-CoA-carboxylase] ligase [Oscillospiraceae bacterium]
MKQEILGALRESDGYISGETLCRRFGVTRAAVWKCVKSLRESGYAIDSSTNRGYKLLDIPDRLLETELGPMLQTRRVGKKIYWFESVDSTNERAKKMSVSAPDGAVFIAEEQTAGKGRIGKSWVSEKGAGIWLSVLLKPDCQPRDMSLISLVAGVAVCEGIEKATGLAAGVKWPNDVLIQNKKVCGILPEMSAEFEKIHHVVLGIGINIKKSSFPAEFSSHAACLSELRGEKIDRKRVAAQVLGCLDDAYDRYIEAGDHTGLLREFRSRCVTMGHEIRAVSNGKTTLGKAVGVDNTGALIVETAGGRVTLN